MLNFFFIDGAGVVNVHAKDGGQKLEIRSGKWLDAAIWKVFTCSLIWQHLAIPHFESPASSAEPHVLADPPRSRVRITRRVLYENPICRAWLAHHNMSSRKNMCGLTILWKLNDNFFEWWLMRLARPRRRMGWVSWQSGKWLDAPSFFS